MKGYWQVVVSGKGRQSVAERLPGDAQTTKRSLFGWIKSHPLISGAIAAFTGATITLVVNRYGPGILDMFSDEPPLRVLVSRAETSYYEGNGVALPNGLEEPRAGYSGSCGTILRQLYSEGAVGVGETYLRISLQGNHETPVVIQNVRAIVERHKPLRHTSVVCPLEGMFDVISMGFNLDDEDPIARTYENGRLGPPYFEGSGISLARGEPVEIAVTAITESCYCEWTMQLVAIVDGEQQTFTLDDHGRPFRTTAPFYGGPGFKHSWYVIDHRLVSATKWEERYSGPAG
jgi:hypothetical protein